MSGLLISVKLYGTLRQYRPGSAGGAPHHPFELKLPDGASVTDLTERLGVTDGTVSAVAVNGVSATVETRLKDGDKVSLFPPAAGGQTVHVFLAGIMQGSRSDHLIGDQDYRVRIAAALREHVPGVRISDPWISNPGSVNYDLARARQTFEAQTMLAAEADVLIAYLPEASMGTAIEMWSAFHANKHIIAVTPLKHNWVVRLTADKILPDLASLLKVIESGRFAELLSPIDAHPLKD